MQNLVYTLNGMVYLYLMVPIRLDAVAITAEQIKIFVSKIETVLRRQENAQTYN